MRHILDRRLISRSAVALTAVAAGIMAVGCAAPERSQCAVSEFEVREVIKSASRSYRVVTGTDTARYTVSALVQWPEQFGANDVGALRTHILRAMFSGDPYSGRSAMSVDDALLSFVGDTSLLDEAGVEITPEEASDSVEPSINDYRMSVAASIMELTRESVTYDVSAMSYLGGAHDNMWSAPFTYLFASGEVLTLSSLFRPGTLAEVSREVNAVAAAQYRVRPYNLTRAGFFADTLRIEAGSVFVEDGAVVFRFDPYEVAPWTEGMIDIEVQPYLLEQWLSPPMRRLFAMPVTRVANP